MTAPTLDGIRRSLEGIIPSFLATCDAEGTPNVSEISQVEYVDARRVALSYQFFNKTRRNVVATRMASVIVLDPQTNAQYRLTLDFEETQTSGPIFESMRAKLAGIASHSAMEGVFRLLGSDIYTVRSIKQLESVLLPAPPTHSTLSAVRRITAEMIDASDLGDLFDRVLKALDNNLQIRHSMIMMVDAGDGHLFTVASRGYPTSGIGSEVARGQGVIGVAAAEGTPIRIGHMASEYSYRAAIRASAGLPMQDAHGSAIPFPGLDAPLSQIALPICARGQTIGILFAESPDANAFGYDDEDALSLVATDLGLRILLAQNDDRPQPSSPVPEISQNPIKVRHYRVDDTVFIDGTYLIKGVAGAIFWKLVCEHDATGRVEFTNRELRLDPSLRLPDHVENLESRLLLLQRRLAERQARIQVCKSGRGRLRLVLAATLDLEEL